MRAPDLLSLAIAAHGGLERWAEVSEIRLHLDSGGLALATKWQARALRGLQAAVATRKPRTVLEPFPRTGLRGVFQPNLVRIESFDGAAVTERREPRGDFRGIRHAIRWDALDVLYFAGYALWNYVTAPFLLLGDGVEAREVSRVGGLRRLAIRFPADVPTHSREQVYWFDERGLLRRLDYTAEVFGRWARAAHFCEGHRQFDGIALATRRRVVPRTNSRALPGPTLVWIHLDDVGLG